MNLFQYFQGNINDFTKSIGSVKGKTLNKRFDEVRNAVRCLQETVRFLLKPFSWRITIDLLIYFQIDFNHDKDNSKKRKTVKEHCQSSKATNTFPTNPAAKIKLGNIAISNE